jgi:hypothetical protein
MGHGSGLCPFYLPQQLALQIPKPRAHTLLYRGEAGSSLNL